MPTRWSTKLFMATAGLYKRRRTHRIAAAVGILAILLLITILSLDMMKVVELPGMGTARGFSGHGDDPETFYSYTDFTTPLVSYGLSSPRSPPGDHPW